MGALLSANTQRLMAASPTTTTLSLTAHGSPVTEVDSHTVVTLTAEVKAGSTILKLGQVKFCDAGTSCQDIHLRGLAQLTESGKARLKLVAGPGKHSYTAIFLRTEVAASSASAAMPLTVTLSSTLLSKTTINATGSNGSYTLTGSVAGVGSGAVTTPTGDVYFLDKTNLHKNNANFELGKAALSSGLPGLSWTVSAFHKVPEPQYGYTGMATGDFNNDGHTDLVVANGVTQQLDILLGDGEGRLASAPGSPIPTGDIDNYWAPMIGVADFNNDGNPDLAVSTSMSDPLGYFTDRLFILLGKGDGTFTRLSGGSTDWIVAGVGDFNHDGNADVLVQGRAGGGDATIEILPGNGDGTFNNSIGGQYVFAPIYLAGDFDGDGNADVATLSFDYPGFDLDVQFGNADGTFSGDQFAASANDEVVPPAFADLNGDGRTDIVLDSGLVLLGNADRTFTAKPTISGSARVIPGDFNGDGNVDVAFGYNDATYPFLVALGNGDGTFKKTAIVPYNLDVPEPEIRLAADFNEDGLSDLTAIARITANPGYGVLLAQATSTVSISGLSPTGAGTHEVVARYEGDDKFLTSVSRPVALSSPSSSTPIATFSTLSLPFGDQAVGESSNAQTTVMTNTGKAALAISSLQLSPVSGRGLSFASSNDCPSSLPAGDSCKIRFRFNPKSVGVKLTQMIIVDSAGNSPQMITLTGRGITAP